MIDIRSRSSSCTAGPGSLLQLPEAAHVVVFVAPVGVRPPVEQRRGVDAKWSTRIPNEVLAKLIRLQGTGGGEKEKSS